MTCRPPMPPKMQSQRLLKFVNILKIRYPCNQYYLCGCHGYQFTRTKRRHHTYTHTCANRLRSALKITRMLFIFLDFSNNPLILGQDNCNVPRLLQIFTKVIEEDALIDSPETYDRVLNLCRHIQVRDKWLWL